MCSHLKMCSHFPYTSFLSFFSLSASFSKPLAFFCFFYRLSLSAFLYLSPSLNPLSLSLTLLLLQPSLSPFYLILSSPLHYSSISFPQEEPQSYLGYVGFGELKSHFTNSLSASPENSAGYLKQFHHSAGFVHWNVPHRATFYSLSPLNANPLPDSPSSRLPPSSFSPSASFLFLH